MKRLLIAGAGGFGRELYGAALEARGYGEAFAIGGFLDDRPDALAAFDGYPPVLAGIDSFEPRADDVFVVALGNVDARRKCAESLAARGARFMPVVHESARIGPNVEIGEGSFIAPGVSITADVSLGRHVCVFHNSSIGHDTRFGDYCHIYAQCSIGGNVTAGERVAIYPGSVVTPRRKLGDGAVVGALSAVFTDVPPGGRVLGNPAAPLD
ncbi:MAG: acetyltransferase [Kiritimatiellae bacterium]|nr:acetyltransferase [Kiritimatiellia bacterium]